MLMGHGTRRSLTFSTTTTNKIPSTTTNKVVTKLDKTILKASPPKEINRAKQEKVHFLGEHKQEEIVVVNEVDGLEGQEELCFVNANGTWYKKEPHFQYQNNYQQKPFYNNQQGSYQDRQNYSQSLSSERNQSTQGQAGSSTSAPQESSTDAMLKQILESQTRSEKHIGYELKNLHTKAVAQLVDKTEHKAMERVKAQAKLKEVQLEEAHTVKQSPYDKLPFPQRFLSKAQKKVIYKFRKDMGDVGVKLPQISNMHDAHGVSRAAIATHDKKKMIKEPHPTPIEKSSNILTLYPMKINDGVIEYKIK
ncbi:hypothetical protein F2Q69_00033600 [Brassica cretica]|uniref:Uncharacterized protein n=1 Tax=Brassica cretica TaxID=69181 RepID=A0A8S9SEP1_BRACR|nr:hypothetical protein F2Q69_00033600 [Brassica cretica]